MKVHPQAWVEASHTAEEKPKQEEPEKEEAQPEEEKPKPKPSAPKKMGMGMGMPGFGKIDLGSVSLKKTGK